MDIFNEINIFLTNLIINFKEIGLIVCSLLILLEAMLPFLPLSLFVTIIFISYGKLVGFLASWIFSVLGAIIVFNIVAKFNFKFKKSKKYLDKFSHISLINLVILYAIPFNPTFLITLICSCSKINIKKYIWGLALGKFLEIYFWGFIGCSFFESLTNIKCIVKVIIGLTLMYIVALIAKKKYKI